ncbi:glucose-6-phosphate isomerase, partial [Chloroflexota bacterium]
NIGEYTHDVEGTMAKLDGQQVTGRIWRKDHTIWKSEPTEITNRMGWLTITDIMREQIPALDVFAQEVLNDGFRHVVLLGMGGSSLGAEVLRQVFSADGYPELMVLDSTVPATVLSVTEAIEPAHTLFLVSSKSGTTTEPLALYRYFRNLLESADEPGKAGRNFVAITDPGTPLVKLAEENNFRRIFLNPTDIGGRYSVLSYFGLVPAALVGADITALLDRADRMREGCASSVPVHENPGAWLGACIGTLASKGKDKLTLLTSPAIGSFGLWVEQLIAESTGKEGKGIIPIAGEPPVEAKSYGDDRLFIYMRLEGDDNADIDAIADKIKASGQPMLTLKLQDRYDLGAEFFRWEFATIIAGAILNINPFDQPDVQKAKDATERLLKDYVSTGHLPQRDTAASVSDLLAGAKKGEYLAIMAYLRQTPEVDRVMAELRQKVMTRYQIATTLGYGPRFLHSTGQLHKGGPNTGLFLQISAAHKKDMPVPDKPYTFGLVADAQALGDLEALQTLGRPVAPIHFNLADAKAISRLIEELAAGNILDVLRDEAP